MTDADFRTVGILGTGTIGSSWASFFAVNGMAVRMFDADGATLERGLAAARSNVDALGGFGLANEDDVAAAKERLRPVSSVAEVASDVGYVQESVVERYDVKKEVFAEMDRASSPETVIASSSSGLLMTEIQKAMERPERALIAHPFNPPHLVPLVELVPGERTSAAIVAAVREFFERLGKTPVVLQKEVPGHIANRLAAALWREAIDLVHSGVATVEDVDRALYAGPGIRWALMGQHMIYHVGGGEAGYRGFIDHIGATFEEYWRSMASWTEIPPEAKEAVVSGVEESAKGRSLADLAAWRDGKLVAVLKALGPSEGRR